MNIDLPYLYEPRDYQKPFCNATGSMKRIVTVWHRRAGKDLSYLSMLVCRMMERVGTYFYVFPTAKQGRKIIWQGIDRDGHKFLSHIPEPLIESKNDTEMRITLVNGSQFFIVGSDNYDDTIVGTNPIGIIFSEYSLQKPEVWDYVRPILAENGGWAWFNFTPRGKNFAYTLLLRAQKLPELWFTQILTVDDTGVLTKDQVEQEIASGMSRAKAEQEFYCSFDAEEPGLIYGHEMAAVWKEKRVCPVDYDQTLPLYTFWDLGVNDAMAIVFFQIAGNRVQVIDYYEDTGKSLKWYYDEILRRYESEKHYRYAEHFGPHDIGQRDMMIADASGNAMTRLEGAASFGLHFTRVRRVMDVWDRIETTRGMFSRIWFSAAPEVERLTDALGSYRKRLNESLSTPEHEVFDAKPLHDWASNPADAFGGMCDAIKQGLCGGGAGRESRIEAANQLISRQMMQRRNYNPLEI